MIEDHTIHYFAILSEMWSIDDKFQGRERMYYFFN